MASPQDLAELPDVETLKIETDCLHENAKKMFGLSFGGKDSPPKSITVMVCGLPRSGKSTALNNLFDLDLPTSSSAFSCTKGIIDETVEKHGVIVRYIDTPGLEAMDAKSVKAFSALKKLKIEDEGFIFLYCHNVTTTFTSVDEKIIKNLDSLLGGVIWSRCVLVMTHCDAARLFEYSSADDDSKYRDFLISHTLMFEDIFRKCKIPVKPVRLMKSKIDDAIIAIPVAKEKNLITCTSIVPFQYFSDVPVSLNWTDLAFTALLKKEMDILTLIKVRYNLSSEDKDYYAAKDSSVDLDYKILMMVQLVTLWNDFVPLNFRIIR